MEGEGQSPKPAPDSKKELATGRSSFVSVDLEEVEEVPEMLESLSSIELESAEDVTDGIDVEFDDGEASVNKILAMTGDGLSLEEQRAVLKEAAKDEKKRPSTPSVKPVLAIPTPFDLGAAEVAEPPPPAPVRPIPPPLPPPPRGSSKTSLESTAEVPARTRDSQTLVELLTARIERLENGEDKVGLSRAHVELAIVHEMLGDDAKVNASASAALSVDPEMMAAHSILRRRLHSRTQVDKMLEHLERELSTAASDGQTVELLAEKARLLDATGNVEQAHEAWNLTLNRAPHHAAALAGLEADLTRRALTLDNIDTWEALVAHLGRMADSFAGQPSLAAFLHVERAWILEHRLSKIEGASGAYDRALRLDSGVGPVRDALTLFYAAQRDAARLAAILADEARLEPTSTRAARLELDAACITYALLNDDARAIALLERAAARAPTTPSVDHRVVDELVRMYESSAQWPEAARSRRARLRFFNDPAALVYELRHLSSIEERLGNMDMAIADIERALTLETSDATLVEDLDRLLAGAGKDLERVDLWLGEAQRAEDAVKRARALARAAQLCENLGRQDEAVRHLRGAWIAAPGDSEILDHLSRLMSPRPSETFDREIRALVELYTQAAESTRDPGRRVAYLEKIAVIWEELVGDPGRAARAYEEILRIEPGRRGAILGLERSAGRVGDDRALSLALSEEARRAEDGADVLALRVRSAQALSRVDAVRAEAMVREVLAQEPAHIAARALETRLHEDAGRWDAAAVSLRARVDLAPTPKEKVSLWLALAQIQDARLRLPKEAAASLEEARRLDPAHPVPPEEIAKVLEAAGDARALRNAIERLAVDAITPQERARYFTHAAEIAELRLDDDDDAVALYTRALKEAPDDELIADRLTRVLYRRAVKAKSTNEPDAAQSASWTKFAAHLDDCAQKGRSAADTQRHWFALAWSFLVTNTELPRATRILQNVLQVDPRHAGALRTLGILARRLSPASAGSEDLARVLRLQGEGFTDVRARLGAFWELAALEAFRLDSGETLATYTRILELDPTDPSALEAAVRLSLPHARKGDIGARRATISALRSLSALAHDESAHLAKDLRLALMLEDHASDYTDAESRDAASREALDRLRDVLNTDPISVTAATCLARLANRLGDTMGAAAAAISLADLAVLPKVRAKYLVDAANLLLGEADERGPSADRAERVAQLLEKALESDPDSTVAAGRLAQVRGIQRHTELLVDVFKGALSRATTRGAIVLLGTELARTARDVLFDPTLAIDSMRRVRQAAPDDVPSLLTLSELYISQGVWPEATEVLEDVVVRAVEPAPRITALFALASIYEKVLSRPAEAERVLRRALSFDERNPRAMRALVHRLAAKQNETDETGHTADKTQAKREIAELLERLADVEQNHEAKAEILIEVADIRSALKDPTRAEKALIEAVATAPQHPRAFARLSRLFRTPGEAGGVDAVSFARALAALIGRGVQLGTQDARWYATLGRIEVRALNRLRDGVVHLTRALEMQPELHECRFELATAYSRLGAHDDASKTVLGMLHASPPPLVSIAEPAAALELLERALNAERRQEEAIVVSELRAIAGELDEGRHAWLRGRRLGPFEGRHATLDRTTLVTHVVPEDGRHVLLDVANAVAGIETRLLRADLTEIAVSSRDRIGKRSGHPTRNLLDRLAKALGIADVELVITPNVTRTRVLAQDAIWIVVPKKLTDLPEPTQLAALGRALARVALNVPWIEELPASHIEAFLIAAARSTVASYAQEDIDAHTLKLVIQYEQNLAKELSRKQKQALEKLAPRLSTREQKLPPKDKFISAMARAELRVAYLLTGDILATIDELRSLDAPFFRATESPGSESLARVLDHPFAGDVVRYALTPEATALRRRVGATWSG